MMCLFCNGSGGYFAGLRPFRVTPCWGCRGTGTWVASHWRDHLRQHGEQQRLAKD